MITKEQWDKLDVQYGKLIYKIAHFIGGDRITNDFEDSVQEVRMACIDACIGYEKKTGLKFDEYFGTEEFGKYIKTVMWNKKNSNGTNIKKKKHLQPVCKVKEAYMGFGSDSFKDDVDFYDVYAELELLEQEMLTEVLNDGKAIKPNGAINIARLARTLGVSKGKIKKTIQSVTEKYEDFHNE
jgi:hypothetical protein